MPATDNSLPEGTDSIITGAGVVDSDLGGVGGLGASSAGAEDYPGGTPGLSGSTGAGDGTAAGAKAKIADAAAGLKGQAADKARDVANQGKAKATEALDNIAQLFTDAAGQVDERVGEQYGAYARQAADAVSSFAQTLRGKEVDELFEDARSAVRKSPAIAIGAAAALGFVLARIAKAGTAPVETTSTGTTGTTVATATPTAYDPTPSPAVTSPASGVSPATPSV